jgi:hypothetical protein
VPLVVSAVAVTCGLVVAALVVRWSLDGLIATPERYGQAADLRVTFEPDDVDAGARRLRADPHVRDVVIARSGEVDLTTSTGRTVQVATTSLQGLDGPPSVSVLDGRAPLGPREIALAPATMDGLGLHVGDHATAAGPCGSFDVGVVGRAIVPLTGNNYPDDGSLLTPDGFDELCAQDLVGQYETRASALVRLRDPADVDAVMAEWDAAGLHVSGRSRPNSVAAVEEVRPVATVGAVLVALLGASSLGHALVLGVRRRRHELAVLRAFGLRPRQTAAVVLVQAATLATVAAVIGIPLGLVAGRLIWTAIARPSNVLVHVEVSALGVALVVLGLAAVALLAAIWPGRRAARLPTAAILRRE